MSYALNCFVIDIPKLKSVIGAGDESLVDAVKANTPEAFDDEEEEEDDEDDEEVSMSTALRQLIMGEELDEEQAHQYGYALQEICEYLGELQDADLWCGVRWSAVEACGLEPLLTKSGPPVGIPINQGDFPAIGQLDRAEMATHLQAANQRRAASQDSEINELLEEYIAWLEAAKQRGLDLVFFYQ